MISPYGKKTKQTICKLKKCPPVRSVHNGLQSPISFTCSVSELFTQTVAAGCFIVSNWKKEKDGTERQSYVVFLLLFVAYSN